MTPAPAAAARNTNIAAEDKTMMTDEELQQTIQELTESIDELSDTDQPLTKEEKKRKQILVIKREVLRKIKEDREKGKTYDEIYNSIYYNLLTSWGEKHPYLASLVMRNFRWGGGL
jgi:uncharacterized membrane-anchored protein